MAKHPYWYRQQQWRYQHEMWRYFESITCNTEHEKKKILRAKLMNASTSVVIFRSLIYHNMVLRYSNDIFYVTAVSIFAYTMSNSFDVPIDTWNSWFYGTDMKLLISQGRHEFLAQWECIGKTRQCEVR